MQEIIRDSSRSNFFMIPNTLDEMNLTVYGFRLYCHYKRVAGENGTCWQSVKTMAEKCNMSMGSVTNARNELVEKNLITVKEVHNPNGKAFLEVTISDIWYKNNSGCSLYEVRTSPHEQVTSPGEHPPSSHEIKNTPLINTPLKNNSFEKTSKEEPTLEPCDIDGIPDSWKDKPKKKNLINPDQQRLAATISSLLGIKTPICNNNKDYAAMQVTWWKPIKEMLHQVDGNVEKAERVVDDVITTYRAANLTMNSPKSLLNGFIGELVNHNKPRKQVGIDINGEAIYE